MVVNGVNFPEDRLAEFCRRHGIARMSLFGSVLHGDADPGSDVDILVEFVPGTPVSLFDVGGMIVELSELLGRQVDLRTPGDLSRYFRASVVREARLLYAA